MDQTPITSKRVRPSTKRSRSRTCSVKNCGNGDYRLCLWREEICNMHNVKHDDELCTCNPPFELFCFPTKLRSKDDRYKWQLLLNRAEDKKIWSPKKQSRVCSLHFLDRMPTEKNPYPTEKLGYDNFELRVKKIIGVPRRQLSYGKILSDDEGNDNDNYDVYDESNDNDNGDSDDINIDERTIPPPVVNSFTLANHVVFRKSFYVNQCFSVMVSLASLLCFGGFFKGLIFQKFSEITSLKRQLIYLKNENNFLKEENRKLKQKVQNCDCEKSVYSKLLVKSKDCLFYTGIKSISTFEKLHDLIAPYVRRRWCGIRKTSTKLKRKFSSVPKRMGPERKLNSRDEFLLMLMKLRLGLFEQDLANRFKISMSLTSNILRSWVKTSAGILSSLVFVPDQGTLTATKPPQFKYTHLLHSIIDATELFTETPKGLVNQRLLWSNYKHHDTLKLLVAVASNSTIIFVSKPYCGSASDKFVTNDCGYLNMVESGSQLMADKGFNIADECAARNIHLIVPPGKRGQSQMLSESVRKTSAVAKMRIIVEQVIRELKTFHILAQEIPISMFPQVNDIVTICSALVNLNKPIYK